MRRGRGLCRTACHVPRCVSRLSVTGSPVPDSAQGSHSGLLAVALQRCTRIQAVLEISMYSKEQQIRLLGGIDIAWRLPLGSGYTGSLLDEYHRGSRRGLSRKSEPLNDCFIRSIGIRAYNMSECLRLESVEPHANSDQQAVPLRLGAASLLSRKSGALNDC